ncbi:omega-crystallin [Clonorchis sinensis]|uniref:Omega-crystallin n=1 Tax=Clonorchis sinensis TaxID=79923 RepID=H2KQG6_CLOSI|nr:omega-crystallin [Clonorchis sinensis]
MFDELHKSTKRTIAGSSGLLRSSSKDSVEPIEQKEVSEFGQTIHDKNAELDDATNHLEKPRNGKRQTFVLSDSVQSDHEKEISALRAECVSLRDEIALHQAVKRHDEMSVVLTDVQLKSYQEQLTNQMNELDQCRQQLIRLQQENEAKQQMLDELRRTNIELQSLSCIHEANLNKIYAEKEELERTVAFLRLQMSSVTDECDQHAADAMRQSTRAAEAIQEVKLLESKWSGTNAQSETREALLQDKVTLLEDRLRILSEECFSCSSTLPNDESVTETSRSPTPMEDSVSAAEDTSDFVTVPSLIADSGTVPSTSAAGDVRSSTAQIAVLLRDRELLTSRLETMRIHLAEAKAQWSDCVAALERQIAHLNSKIAEDSIEHRRIELAHRSTINSLKLELDKANTKLEGAMKLIRMTEESAARKILASESQSAEWVDERTRLAAELAGLSVQAERTVGEQNEAIQDIVTIQTEEERLWSQLKIRSDELARCERDVLYYKAQYDAKCHELQDMETERLLESQRSTDLIKQLERARAENQEYMDQLDQCRDELRVTKTKPAAPVPAFEDCRIHLKDPHNNLVPEENSEIEAKLRDTELQLKTKIRENEDLLKKISELSAEGGRLPGRIQTVESADSVRSVLEQKDQMISLLQKRLKELKRMLAEQLRLNRVPSDQDSVDGLVTGWYPSPCEAAIRSQSPERVSLGSVHSWPPLPLNASNNNTYSVEANSKYPSEKHSPHSHSSRSSSGLPTAPTYATSAQYPSKQNTNTDVPPELVNFRYLRHIVIKFLLSRENEALQLVRVLSTLLYLTTEEEKLLRQSLRRRRSWIRSRPSVSPSKAHGQFAKIIPPPL